MDTNSRDQGPNTVLRYRDYINQDLIPGDRRRPTGTPNPRTHQTVPPHPTNSPPDAARVTLARRITRAKEKIKAAHIPYRVPSADDIRERLTGVLAVVYPSSTRATSPARETTRYASTSTTRRSTLAACSGLCSRTTAR